MKTLLSTILLAFLVSALGDSWTPVQETRSAKDSVLNDDGDTARMSIVKPGYRHRKVALQSEERLPLRLAGLGSQRSLRDQIVAPENPAANLHVGLAVGGTNSLEVSTGKWSYGYSSWEECVADTPFGYQIVFDKFKTNKFNPSEMVYVILQYTYFNYEESLGIYRTALLIYMPLCRFDQLLSLDNITRPLTFDCPTRVEQVVLPVPSLFKMKFAVELDPAKPEQIAVLEWKAPRELQMSNWPESGNRTVETYLYITRWMGVGQYKSRVWLKTKSGEEATYTHFGEMVSPPTFELSRNGRLNVGAAHGSDVEIFVSTNTTDWVLVHVIRNTEPVTTLSVPFTEKMLLFRGVSY